MVTLLFLLIMFHHMDTVLVVLFVFLNLHLYIKIPNWMPTLAIGFMHINVVL